MPGLPPTGGSPFLFLGSGCCGALGVSLERRFWLFSETIFCWRAREFHWKADLGNLVKLFMVEELESFTRKLILAI